MIQGGAGTSTNMNANEVIANRALEHLGHGRGDYSNLCPLVARLAQEALETGSSLYNLVVEKELMTRDQLDNLLLPENLTMVTSPSVV